jgi:proteasome component ECM29
MNLIQPMLELLQAFLAAISFLEACRRQKLQAVGAAPSAAATAPGTAGGMTPQAAASYLLLLENALLPAAPSELHGAALGATLSVAAAQQGAFAAAFAGDASRQQLLLHLLAHVDATARQAAAQLLGLLVPHLGGQDPQHQQQQVAGLCDSLLSTLRAGTAEGAKHAKQEQLEGAAAAAGYVAAHLIQGTPAVPQELLLSLLQQLRQLLDAPAGAAASGTATAGSGSLRAAAALALGHASLPLAAAGSGDSKMMLQALPDAAGAAAKAATLLEDKDPKVAKRAAAALGYICWGHATRVEAAAPPAPAAPAAAAEGSAATSAEGSSNGGGDLLQSTVTSLLAMRSSKNEEVLFAVGEALCFCFGGRSGMGVWRGVGVWGGRGGGW